MQNQSYLPFTETELEELLTYNGEVKKTRPKDQYGLTPKQKRFADLLLQGKQFCEAYRGSHDTETEKFSTIYSEAYKLKELPKIKYYLEIKGKELAEKADITAQEIINNLAKETRIAGKASDRIRANEVLAKIKGLYKDGTANQASVFIMSKEFIAPGAKNEPS